MNKQNALQAWIMLVMSLPKGIVTFVIAVTGVCLSLPLVILWIGIPLLTATFTVCRLMMRNEEEQVEAWLQGKQRKLQSEESGLAVHWSDWRSLWHVLRQGETYRGIAYSIAQLPIGIAAFTIAIVLPVTAFTVVLSPLAYKVSLALSLPFNLYSIDGTMQLLLPDFTMYQRSWVAAAIGLVLVLLLPRLLRGLGRLYAAWIIGVSSTQRNRLKTSGVEENTEPKV